MDTDKKTTLNQKTIGEHKLVEGKEREAGYNLSWGSVFAGILTFIALALTFSLINAALGLGQFDPTSSNPFAGVGTGQAIWTVIALALAFLGAGFVAGLTSRRMGSVHGFLTWAGSLLATIILLVWVASTALSAAGSAISSVANVTGDAIGSVASTAGDAISSGVNALADSVNVTEKDVDQFKGEVQSVLKDTDVPELQPDYLSKQVDGAVNDISQAAKDLAVKPENADKIFQNLGKSLTSRVDNIAENVDEKAVANAIEANTDLNQAEAEKTTENIVDGYQKAAATVRDGIQQADEGIQQVSKDLSQSIDQLKTQTAETTNDVTNSASSGSIWAFVAVVVGAILSVLGGTLGVNTAVRWVNEDKI